MASFSVHLSVAAGGGTLLASALLGAETVSLNDVAASIVATTVGGVLPDLDADDSSAVRGLFSALGVVVALLVMTAHRRYSLVELWVLGTLTFVAVRLVLLHAFERFTVHRGVFHSLLAGLFFWFATAAFTHHVLLRPPPIAWLLGFFLFLGFLIHLGLDEIYSVDLLNVQVKASFGSALKALNRRDPLASLLMALAAVAAFLLAPSPAPFLRSFLSLAFLQELLARLLPRGGWFR